ncbi:hypothetical protein FY528_04150 [Hymenobacter lutimineralis]|uniref:Glycosyltransferase RgtA/B/C/D-like domain-containing protein n=1 Tax=Hymenobacter lutimineralis TaxID=2606448 RepID=A0A5D6VAD6_9BACT|nr:hypothetical protein [Hymenobacter lutimineralis]TYZ12496.1 hypothetical protein FY528_04150 [Hymenobacter lutimineralis]
MLQLPALLLSQTPLSARQTAWLKRHYGWLLGALWLLMQVALLWKHGGPRHVNDSNRYIIYATQIAEQWFFEHDHNLRYVGYPFYCSLWLALGWGEWGIVLGQMLVAGAAAWAFHQALLHLTGRALVAGGATALLLGWFDTQNLNAYVLTESLFTSGIILCFWAFTKARNRWGIIRLVLLALGTALLRPNGFLVPLALLIGAGWQWRRWLLGPACRPWLALVVLAAAPVVWVVLNKLLLTFTLVETYLRGEIIYAYTAWTLQPREPLQLPPPGLSPVLRLGYFVLHNPVYVTKLALLKGGLFFSYVKSYYSFGHVLAVVLVIYPCYWLAWVGSRAEEFAVGVRTFLVAVVALQGFIVMLTVEDWDVRFLIPVLPCIFALAALGAATLLARFGEGPPRTARPESLPEPSPGL